MAGTFPMTPAGSPTGRRGRRHRSAGGWAAPPEAGPPPPPTKISGTRVDPAGGVRRRDRRSHPATSTERGFPMTATTVSTDQHTDVTGAPVVRPKLWTAGLASGAVAAVATNVTVAVARAAGEDVAVAGEQIPLAGFAQFVLIGALLGVVMAKVFARRASRPQRTFVRTTVALTALSIVPDLMIDA